MRITPENSLDTIKVILISILLNLKDLHARKIIHRDIKPQNIHIDSSLQCKLIDFGLSLDVTNPLEKQYFRKCGTIGYMAPEVFMNEFAFVRPYSSKCDLFSLGIIAHMLLMGINPIKGKSYE
jgi:serine/threonine protein kinase